MRFFWIGSHEQFPANLNTNNLTAVTGDAGFISTENLWNNPANWGVYQWGQNFTTAFNRYPVAGDIAMFQGFSVTSLDDDGGGDLDWPTVDGITYCRLPRSECLYGGISTDGKWYDEGTTGGGTTEGGLTAQSGTIRVEAWDGYDQQLIESFDNDPTGYPCGSAQNNGGQRARIGVLMGPGFSGSSGTTPVVGDWYGLSLNCENWASHNTVEMRVPDTRCRTTLGGRTNIDAIQVRKGAYIEFCQGPSSAGCTIGNIYINRRGITFDDWWDGKSSQATSTMTISTVPVLDEDARSNFWVTGPYHDISEKIMSSNITYSQSVISEVVISSSERTGGPKNVPLGMTRVPYKFYADIGSVTLHPQNKETQTVGDQIQGWDEIPNTCSMFSPKWSKYSGWGASTGLSLGNLIMPEDYGSRDGTKYNNSVMLVPNFQGTADANITNLESYSGWILPHVEYTDPDVKLIVIG